MSFTINPKYSNAVESFVWPTSTSSRLALSAPITVAQLVQDIFQQIKQVFEETRVGLSALAGKELSKIEVCYIATQNSDVHFKQNTALQIQNASQQVKDILHHINNQIANRFPEQERGNVRTAVLLFGIHHVNKKMHTSEAISKFFSKEDLEESLGKLITELHKQEEAVLQTKLKIEDLRSLLEMHVGSAASPITPTTVSSPTILATTSPALFTPAKKVD